MCCVYRSLVLDVCVCVFTGCHTWTGYLVNLVHNIWTCEAQKVIVSHQRLGMVFKFIPSEVALLKLMLLNHGSHAAVENHDPPLQYAAELRLQGTFARFH